jgi:dipeptidyl aminopeptidase/acylaminoacyl peptidase
VPFSINPDGSLLYRLSARNGGMVIESITLDASETVASVPLSSEGDVQHAVASPDGSYLAFASNESGRYQVYTVSWPEMTGRQQVSLEGGVEPRWTKDGRELVFRSGESILPVRFDVSSGVPGTPEELFTAPMLAWNASYIAYDVTADGERFFMVTRPPERAPRRIIVITNFFEELTRMVGEAN